MLLNCFVKHKLRGKRRINANTYSVLHQLISACSEDGSAVVKSDFIFQIRLDSAGDDAKAVVICVRHRESGDCALLSVGRGNFKG